jgi:hypothetical protein
MRIFTLVSLGLILSLNSQAQQSQAKRQVFGKRVAKHNMYSKTDVEFLPKLTMEYGWESGTTSWGLNDSVNTTYNAAGLPSAELTTALSGAQRQVSYEYDSAGNETIALTLTRDDMFFPWDSISKTITSYDQHGKEAQYEEYSYDETLGWYIEFGYKTTTTYNSSNLPATQEISSYDDMTETYVKEGKAVFEYDNTGKLKTVTNMNWNGTAYVNDSKTAEIVWHTWDAADFESSLPTSGNEYDWNSTSSTFVLSGRFSHEYDSLDNETLDKEETLVGSIWKVDYAHQYMYTYDANYTITEKIEQSWSTPDSAFVNNMKYVYSNFMEYTPGSTGIRTISDQSASLMVYPNPFAEQAIISLSESKGDAQLALYDLNGRNVRNVNFVSGKGVLDKGELASGIYFYIVTSSEKAVTSGKIVIK